MESNALRMISCTGCTECANICMHNAIEMKKTSEGFLYPVINNDKCINCGLCERWCINNRAIEKYDHRRGKQYICHLREQYKEVVRKSASGGGFSGIALYFLRKYNAVVFGACMDKNNIVKHTWIDSVENLVLLQNSKYVQSDMGDSFQKVRDFLMKGRYVVFSGTPCQIAGLKHFLSFHKVRCSDERLITVDIICHGVPSAKLLDYDIRNEFNGFKVMGIKFRKKTAIGKSKSKFALCLKTNHFFTSVLEPSTDLFYNSFLKGISFRESCYNCLFAEANRIGDFTVGDCDSKAEYTSFHEYESCSTLLCNSGKAMSEWGNGLSSYFDFLMLDYEKEVGCNGQLRSPFSRPKERDEIYLDIENLDYKSVKKKYTESGGLIRKVKFYISCNTPQELFAVWANIKRCLLRKCK